MLSAVRTLLVTGGVGKLRPTMLALGFRECWMDILPSFKEAAGVVKADDASVDGKNDLHIKVN